MMIRTNSALGDRNIESEADRLAPLLMRHATGHAHDFATRNVVTGSTSSTIGSDNVYMGYQAAQNAESGATSNVVIGSQAANTLTTGDGNVAIGHNAANVLTTGSFNVAIGAETISDAGGHTGVVAIGYTAGNSTSGSRNTFVGYGAGASSANDDIVAIGYNAGAGGSGGCLYIANSSSESRMLITGHFANRNLFLLGIDPAFGWGGGAGTIVIKNATTVPASNYASGGVLYVESGALKWRGSGGTITTLGAA